MTVEGNSRRGRFGAAEAIGCILLVVLGIVFVADMGVSSFTCMNSQDSMACTLGAVAGHLPVYLAAIIVIGGVWYVVRRITR